MIRNVGVKIVALNALVAVIGTRVVGNSFGGDFNNLWDEKRRFMALKEERSVKPEILNHTIVQNGIVYIEINELNPEFNKIKTIEDDIKSILAMNGVKYVYKRQFYWRTWREVQDANGNSSLVCYSCQNILNVTCTRCNCGYWEIEVNPPCPFEIFSVINNTNICVAYYNELNSEDDCPSIISFKDLWNCDNPIKTRWRVSRQHSATNVLSERHMNDICKGRENCEFSTIYSIFPDRVTFSIINSTNSVIYSRIMKNGNRNYACLNCGVFKPLPKTNLQHWKPSLTSKVKTNMTKKICNKKHNKTIKKHSRPEAKTAESKRPLKLQRNTVYIIKKTTTAKKLRCKHLQIKKSEEDQYEEGDY